MYSDLIDKTIVVRSSPSGVHLGTLVEVDGTTYRLRNARRAWSWQGALDVTTLAMSGPTGGRFSEPSAVAIIHDVCEAHLATEEAIAKWDAVESWTA